MHDILSREKGLSIEMRSVLMSVDDTIISKPPLHKGELRSQRQAVTRGSCTSSGKFSDKSYGGEGGAMDSSAQSTGSSGWLHCGSSTKYYNSCYSVRLEIADVVRRSFAIQRTGWAALYACSTSSPNPHSSVKCSNTSFSPFDFRTQHEHVLNAIGLYELGCDLCTISARLRRRRVWTQWLWHHWDGGILWQGSRTARREQGDHDGEHCDKSERSNIKGFDDPLGRGCPHSDLDTPTNLMILSIVAVPFPTARSVTVIYLGTSANLMIL